MTMSNLNENIKKLKFFGKWRSYQQRVLDELNYHLNDKKLNVVAAPGAGKTTLGIEVMLRLGQPALILAPTITIRNQWKQRIIDNFIPKDSDTDWISIDIKEISTITISTYQGLHSIFKNKEDKEKFIKELKQYNVNTLIFDEAHHLRTEWYVTLDKLCEELASDELRIVSLTGTPPYDVSPVEWENYTSLCGPVDAEISIPELVKAGDLCPHQDLIYFSDLADEEKKLVYDFEEKRNEFFKYIKSSSDLLYAIEGSPFLTDLANNVDIIYKNDTFVISLISYLLYEDELSTHARILTEFLGLELSYIPKFNYEIAENLFDGILGEFEDYFKNTAVLKGKLKEAGLINGKKVDFTGKNDLKKLFARSVNKLNAIHDITELELNNLGENLREVVLLDYIGKGDSEGVNILSVFNNLSEFNTNIGILTGTVIVIPQAAKEELYKLATERNIPKENILTVEFQQNYLRVETYGNSDIVAIITELFEKGYINVMIGTAALLGEGWDSPAVNTLIIASVVGSFMLSNQMRGRALRINKKSTDKTSNIWHLVSLGGNLEENQDWQTALRRFKTFEGVSYTENKIQNGIERLNISTEALISLNCTLLNKQMTDFATARQSLKEKWEQVFNKTKKNIVSRIYSVAEINTNITENTEYTNFLQKLTGDLYKRHKIKLSQIEQIGIAKALLKTLWDTGKINTYYENIKIKTNYSKNDRSKFTLTILGCTDNERNIFMKNFCDIFVINDTNRYLLKLEYPKNTAYLPVPEYIGAKQEYVKHFARDLKNILHSDITAIDKTYGLPVFLIFFITGIIGFAYTAWAMLLLVLGFFLPIWMYNKFAQLQEPQKIGIIFAKSAKNRQEVLKAKYKTYINADIKQSRIWI